MMGGEFRFSIDGGPFAKPTWVVTTTAPASIALGALVRALSAAKYRLVESSPSRARLKAGSALRFIASSVVGVELIPGMRSWGFEARATLSADVDAERTRIIVTLDRLAHGSTIALPYTARALDDGAAALLAAGYGFEVAPSAEGKGLHRSDEGR